MVENLYNQWQEVEAEEKSLSREELIQQIKNGIHYTFSNDGANPEITYRRICELTSFVGIKPEEIIEDQEILDRLDRAKREVRKIPWHELEPLQGENIVTLE